MINLVWQVRSKALVALIMICFQILVVVSLLIQLTIFLKTFSLISGLTTMMTLISSLGVKEKDNINLDFQDLVWVDRVDRVSFFHRNHHPRLEDKEDACPRVCPNLLK